MKRRHTFIMWEQVSKEGEREEGEEVWEGEGKEMGEERENQGEKGQ